MCAYNSQQFIKILRMFFFILIVLFVQETTAARILAFFPFGSKSHQTVFRPVIQELGRRGHHITYFTSVPIEPTTNITIVNMRTHTSVSSTGSGSLIEFGKSTVPMMSYKLYQIGIAFSTKIWEDQDIVDLMNSDEEYDMVIHGGLFVHETAAAVAHKFNALNVAIMPIGDVSWTNEISGLPDNPSYMVDWKTRYSDKMNLFERIQTAYSLACTTAISYYFTQTVMSDMADKYLRYDGWESRPPLIELLSDQALILTNSHHSVGYAYPKAPHLKEIGGVHILPTKPLPKDLEEFMTGAKHGVIYFSLGTTVPLIDEEFQTMKKAFEEVFRTIKQHVLWKWSEPNPPTETKNVKVSKWFPQQSVLAHKNVKLFITHGGLLSISEAVNFGIPIVGIPLFADQHKNVARAKNAGYSIELSIDNITTSSLSWSINEVLNNPKYKIEVERRSKLFKDRPMKPVDEAAYWIEYVLRYGKVLQPASVHMKFYQVYCLDIIAVLISALVLMYCIVGWAIKGVIRKLKGVPTKLEKLSKKQK